MMGMVRIIVGGSFKSCADHTYSAEEGGHVMALQRAIETLVNMIPQASQLDHELQVEGDNPPLSAFGTLPE